MNEFLCALGLATLLVVAVLLAVADAPALLP